jgi:predicted amidohydrolase
VKIALCAANMGKSLHSFEDFTSRVDDILNAYEAEGVDLVVFPEYFSMYILDFAPNGMTVKEEVPYLSDFSGKIKAYVAKSSARTKMAILFGTFPIKKGNKFRNRSMTFFPDGTTEFQDKINLTPSERDKNGWMLEPGERINTFTFNDIEFGVIICHDVTSDEVVDTLKDKNVDVVLVPSMTEKGDGIDSHKYIFANAKEVSSKLQIPVLAVGAIGLQHLSDRVEKNVGGAAFYRNGQVVNEIGPRRELGDKDALTLIAELNKKI